MKKKVGIIKRVLCIGLIFLLSINSFAAIVSDNDGSAFITKAEFDALKSTFQSQIDTYNTSIDSKIDGAIAAYLAGIKLATAQKIKTYFPGKKVAAYGTANEETFKAKRYGFKGTYVSGNASTYLKQNGGATRTTVFGSSFSVLNWSVPKTSGLNKIVDRKWSTDVNDATEWLGFTHDFSIDYNGYLIEYDGEMIYDTATGTFKQKGYAGSRKSWTELDNTNKKNIQLWPDSAFLFMHGATTQGFVPQIMPPNPGNPSQLDGALYVTADGSGTKKRSVGPIRWLVEFNNGDYSTDPGLWAGIELLQLATPNDNSFWTEVYGDLYDTNIILLNSFNEDYFFTNKSEYCAWNNYWQMPPYWDWGGNQEMGGGPMVISTTALNSAVAAGHILPVDDSSMAGISVSYTMDTRDKDTVATKTYPQYDGFYISGNTLSPMQPSHPKYNAWPHLESGGFIDEYYFWPQKGWDPYVKYNQLFCSDLQNEIINADIAAGPAASMLKTCQKDSKKKLTCYAGLPLVEIPVTATSVSIPIHFETSSGVTDTNYYDLWMKFDPFTATTNPKNETGLFTGMSIKSSHTIDGTTKAIKVKSGDTVTFTPTQSGKLFLKWSKNGNVGTGGGIFVVPDIVEMVIE